VRTKRQARILALQALFEIDGAGHSPQLVAANRLADKPLPAEGQELFQQLVIGVVDHQSELDGVITRIAADWPVEQMALIDRNILRMAIFEIALLNQTPVKVAINEAVELAKLFGSESSRRFVNGVLGTLVAMQETGTVGRLKTIQPS